MNRIAELIVRIADLLEAEGRSLRESARGEGRRLREIVSTMAIGLVFVAVAAPVMLLGFGLIIYGILLQLGTMIGPAGAAVATGVLALAVAVGCLYLFKRMTQR